MSTEEVDRYLRELDQPKRGTLEQLRQTILELLPEAEQGLSYGVPAFRVHGKAIAGFSAAKNHLSYLPHSGAVLSTLEPTDLEGHTASKGALRSRPTPRSHATSSPGSSPLDWRRSPPADRRPDTRSGRHRAPGRRYRRATGAETLTAETFTDEVGDR